jgi:hypothetical protein
LTSSSEGSQPDSLCGCELGHLESKLIGVLEAVKA